MSAFSRRMQMNALAHLCKRLPLMMEFQEKFSNDSIYETIHNMGLTPIDSMKTCIWQNKLYLSCPFVPTLTDEGVCFTFNALNSNDIYTNE